MVCRTSSRLKTRRDNDLPLETSISASRQTLQDLKPLLEDRGSISISARLSQKVQSISVTMDGKRCNSVNNVQNNIILEESCKYDRSSVERENKVSEGDSSFSSSDVRYKISRNDDLGFRLSNSSDGSDYVKCKVIGDARSVVMASSGLFWRLPLAVLVMVFTAIALESVAGLTGVSARSAELPRYETAYACEGKTLKIGCSDGAVIHLIRANYGRFSITICNDHGNTDWSVNCMSTRSLRVLHTRCSMNQNCSILASTNMFGDPCPNTLKYLEAHYQCIPAASTTSTTYRPSPPWLMTSQPSVWRSTTPAAPPAPADAQPPKRRPSVITPPTFRPHITMPPELKPGDVAKVKTTSRQPENREDEKPESDSSKETKDPKDPASAGKETNMDTEIGDTQKGEKQQKTNIDEHGDELPEEGHWPVDDEPTPPSDSEHNADKEQEEHRHVDGHHDVGGSHHDQAPGSSMGALYCGPAHARQLHWNWTAAGSLAVQPCPGGATGLARWRCTLVPPHPGPAAEEQTGAAARRRGGGGLQSGENFADLGLNQAVTSQRQSQQLMRRLSGDSLLIGRDTELPADLTDYRDSSSLMLPDAQASSSMDSVSIINGYGDAVAIWMPETPDLSECRSVWLNSLEARVREGESLLSISNDLAQVTSSKTLYGGDMMTTTNIMKRLAQRMSLNVVTFPDNRQREAIVTDMLLGVVKTGSNLLEESQRASWKDLSHAAQMRVATSMLIGLEENAFLLAEALLREKTILQQVKNILLSVRVLETRNVEDEVFPSAVAREQWIATEDVITLPRAALIGNSVGGLVRIVFVAFDRLEEILQPLPSESLPRSQGSVTGTEAGSMQTSSLNSERGDRMNVTKVLNSKIISASLGKGRHIQLSEMVKLTLKHIRTENVSNPTCVFWDYTVNVWSSEGCHVEWWNATHTGCSCAHLTNFAVLMDLHDTRLAPAHVLALRIVTLVGCLISSVALLAAVIVFQCFRNMKSERVTIHKNLCLCLLVAEVVFMCGIDQTQNRLVCGLIAAVLHYFFLAAFAWMFLEGFHLYAMLVEVFEPERARSRWYCVAAYLAPACVVGASAAADYEGYGTPRHCWLSAERMFIMSFVGPVAVVLMANWVCLSMVIYMMCHHSNVSVKSKENTKLYKIRVWLKSSVVLAFLLGLTWTFGLLYLNEQTVAVAYVFTALNSLQGLFIFVFHCLQNEMFQKECARLARRHRWLACCLSLAGGSGSASGGAGASAGSGVPNNNAATASTSNHAPPDHHDHHHDTGLRHGSMKNRRYHQSSTLEDDSLDAREGVTSYKLQTDDTMSRTNWHVRPSAPVYTPGDDLIDRTSSPNHHPTRTPTPQNVVNNIPNSVSHTQSIASMHSFQGNPRMHHLEAADFENRSVQSRSPQSCYSNGKMACSGDGGWTMGGVNGNSNAWKQNTSSKHYHQGGTSTLPHHDSGCHSGSRQLSQHSPYGDAPPSPHHSIKESEESPLHHHGYHGSSRGLYPHAPEYGTGRNPHVFMSQHSPGSQEMIFRKHCKEEGTGRRPKHRDHGHHHYRQGDGINHTYSEIGSQPGRMYRRDSEQEFRVIHDDPVYEEIERNETLMSDMSDDNSGPDGLRQPGVEGHHGSGRFYADHRPLISYSPGERHERERGSPIDHYGKYNPVNAKWDTLERQGFERYEGGRLVQHPAYHQPQENNMRALAAVLNGENNVVCHLEPHRGNQTNYDAYQPQSGNSRTVSQPSF